MNIKAVIFDADGMAIHNGEWQWFSKRFSNKYGVAEDLILPFFKNEFQQCLIGKADLKEELKKYVGQWGWKGSMDELWNFISILLMICNYQKTRYYSGTTKPKNWKR